ncbi:MAG: hypothetical protein KC613_26775, partial [Myxococcales bacterium]|nr:hypothetical protein [Myxococcales bacterium]
HGLHHAGGWPEVITVLARPTELKVAYTLIEAEQRPEPPPALLPLNPTPQDVLALHVREPADRIEAAGLTNAVTQARARLDRSAAAAAQALSWLGVTPEDVRALVLRRLGDQRAEPEPKVITVETNGQVWLLDG